MVKAFISHSSAQQEFVQKMGKQIGLDSCVIDERTFESGRLFLDEIITGIERCEIFVFLISDEALNSKWVNEELSEIRKFLQKGELKVFIPFIIDEKIDYRDNRIKAWIRDEYNLNMVYNSPIILGRKIQERIRNYVWDTYPNIRKKDILFKGRDFEIGQLEQKYYEDIHVIKKCIIVSGFPKGVGRRRFITEYIVKNLSASKDLSYKPICVELGQNNSIEDLLFQLNDILLEFPQDDILSTGLESKEIKINRVILLLNKLLDAREMLIIRDNGACVLSNGHLSEWFAAILADNLPQQLCLFVASKYTPKSSIETHFPQLISFFLKPLTKESSKVLLLSYADILGFKIDDESAKYIIEQASGIPSIILHCVDSIKLTIGNKCKVVDEIIKSAEVDYTDIISIIKENELQYQTLILISLFDFVSFNIINAVFKKLKYSPDDTLMSLYHYSLYEFLGGNNQYIRVNPVMSDFVNRNRLKLNDDFKRALDATLKDYVIDGELCKYDLSGYLLGISNAIKSNIKHIDKKYLIPSFVLKAIVESYQKRNYDDVICLCDKLLYDSNHFFNEIIRSVRYWLCLALCRLKQKERLFEESKSFDEYSKNFLRGFYWRCAGRYQNANEYYEEALKASHNDQYANYIAKAKHELVLVKIKLGDYSGGLDLAKENYESQPNNRYHVEAYFRCLIRSRNPNVPVLKKLLEQYNSLASTETSVIIAKTLAFEYSYYINNDFYNTVDKLRQLVQDASSGDRYYPWRSLNEILSKRDSVSMGNDLADKYKGELEDKIEEEEEMDS